MSVDLSRYIDKQKKNYTNIYVETMFKRYDSGWVDYVFPRLKMQEDSERSKGYGLTKKEINAFWLNKYLRNNMIKLLELIYYSYEKEEYNTIFSERARYKIQQSLNIFKYKQESDILKKFISKFYKE